MRWHRIRAAERSFIGWFESAERIARELLVAGTVYHYTQRM